jgi:hypothetical protein
MQRHIQLILLCEAETALCLVRITEDVEAIQQENDQYPLREKACDILKC